MPYDDIDLITIGNKLLCKYIQGRNEGPCYKEKGKDKDTPQKDQAYWSGRRKELQTKLDSDQTLSEAVQSRINALTADFSARADPVQRAGIERDRLKAIGELDRLRKSVQDGKKALTDLDDDARKAGVPPGWLR